MTGGNQYSMDHLTDEAGPNPVDLLNTIIGNTLFNVVMKDGFLNGHIFMNEKS